MNKQYIRNGLEYYMEVEPIGGEHYEYEMLKENKIANLLPLQIRQVNQQQYLYYSAAGVKPFWITIQKMWITGEQLYLLVDNLLDTLKELNRYFLSADNLVLERESLFLDLTQFQFHFLYVPGYQQDIFMQMKALIEYMVGKIDYKEKEGAIFAYGLCRLLKEETVDMEEIRIYLEQSNPLVSPEQKEKDSKRQSQQQDYDISEQEDRQECRLFFSDYTEKENDDSSDYEEKDYYEKNRQKKASFWIILFFSVIWLLLFMGTAVIFYLIYWYGILEWKRNCLIALIFFLSVDTVCLFTQWKKKKQEEEAASVFQNRKPEVGFEANAQANIQPEMRQEKIILDGTMLLTDYDSGTKIARLIPCEDEIESQILLTKFPFIIGSYHTGIDYQLERKQISRFHAAITKEKDIFMIKDLQSTNGTFINEKKLNGEEERPIFSGDIIRFADLNYRFIE